MNDPSELSKGPEILAKIYKSIFKNCSAAENFNNTLSSGLLHFACSASKCSNILSLWRAYANDGFGFSIGIDEEELELSNHLSETSNFDYKPYKSNVDPNFDIGRVFYNENEFKKHFTTIMEVFKDENGIPFSEGSRIRMGSLSFIEKLSAAGCLLKSDFYEEEKEIRIFKTLAKSKLDWPGHWCSTGFQKLDYIASSTGIKSFINFQLGYSARSAIKEIVIGPQNNSTIEDIEIFLKLHNINNAVVSKSKGKYCN